VKAAAMFSPAKILNAFIALLTAASAASLTFQNRSPFPICYKVEHTFGNVSTNSICDFAPGLFVNRTQNITVHPTLDFLGAFTAMSMNGTKGSRHEFNYKFGTDGQNFTWYDVDYEMGMSNSTFGPVDHRNRTNGLPSLAGERDLLAKANAAWVQVTDKSELLPHYYYLDHRATGNLSVIRMDKMAPFAVLEFFQMKANLTGYVGAGSIHDKVVNPKSKEGKFVAASDKQTYQVSTQDMEIIAY